VSNNGQTGVVMVRKGWASFGGRLRAASAAVGARRRGNGCVAAQNSGR